MRLIRRHSTSTMTFVLGLVTLASLASPAHAQVATSAAAYCATSKGAVPKGLTMLSADAKSNMCQWMKDAEISPERFDSIVAKSIAAGNTADTLNTAFQAEADLHGRNARALAKIDFGQMVADMEKTKQTFYERLVQNNSSVASAN